MSSATSVTLASLRSVIALAIHPGGVRDSSVPKTTLPPLTDVSGLDLDAGAHFDVCSPLLDSIRVVSKALDTILPFLALTIQALLQYTQKVSDCLSEWCHVKSPLVLKSVTISHYMKARVRSEELHPHIVGAERSDRVIVRSDLLCGHLYMSAQITRRGCFKHSAQQAYRGGSDSLARIVFHSCHMLTSRKH